MLYPDKSNMDDFKDYVTGFSDTGTGITAEDQPHIFERFMKGSKAKWVSRKIQF